MGKGHASKSFSMPASGELNYVFGYAQGWVISSAEDADFTLETNNYTINNKDLQLGYDVTKNIAVGADGNETISFVDNDGKLVATCSSGLNDNQENTNNYSVTSFIKGFDHAQRYIDIHITEGTETSLDFGTYYGGYYEPSLLKFDVLDLDKNVYV
jgi:hypothetical protein